MTFAKRGWIKWAAVAAAAICVIAILAIMANKKQAADVAGYSGLPKLSVNTGLPVKGGIESHLAFNIEELCDNNPWTEDSDLAALPVFKNTLVYDAANMPINALSAEEMLAKAKEVANMFGLEIKSLYTTPEQEQTEKIMQKLDGADEQTIKMNTAAREGIAECDKAFIDVGIDGHIHLALMPETAHLAKKIAKLGVFDNFTVSFEYGYETINGTLHSLGFPLPGGRRFAYEGTSREQAMEITKYLFSEYGAFAKISEPGYNLFADYAFGKALRRLHTAVFDNSGSLEERILNFNFANIYFSATDMGGLGQIIYSKTDLSQKIGDYPIITAAEAHKLLLDGKYISTVPQDLPAEEHIARVELIYRKNRGDAVLMPYYKFFVEMPAMQRKNGLKTFGVFYVPAVSGEFLENMPFGNGSPN